MKNIKEFETFKAVYLGMIIESTFYKNRNKRNSQFNRHISPIIDDKEILYIPKTENEFIKALKNAKWIYDNEKLDLLYNEDVIYETPGSLDYPGILSDKIITCENYEKMSNDEVLSYINKDWKYYNELKKNGKTILVFKFDFSNINDIKNKFYLINLNKKILNLYVKEFLNNSNSFGCYFPFKDMCIFAFNEEKYTKKTILHEFTHYLQEILNVEMVKVKDDLDKDKLKFLNLTDNDLNIVIGELMKEHEIIPYVNEFCENVMNIFKEYQKLKKDLEWSNTFIEYFINVLLNSEDIKNEELFKVFKKVSNNDMLPLYVVLGCFVYEIDLDKIKKIMFKENKWID